MRQLEALRRENDMYRERIAHVEAAVGLTSDSDSASVSAVGGASAPGGASARSGAIGGASTGTGAVDATLVSAEHAHALLHRHQQMRSGAAQQLPVSGASSS